ncbi:MAG: cyclic pyranopterin monophosphate synthase MoaC [Gemmatimonadales bacterium]
MTLTHLDADGRPKMVDVGDKPTSVRTARASGTITMSPDAYALVEGNSGPKGDVLTTAQLAGTMGAKRTADLVPLCHPIGLDHVRVTATLNPDLPGVTVEAEAKATARTGVEMEALTAVAVALLTVYDMVKAAGHGMTIGDVRLIEKTGGTHGDWSRA